MANTDVVAGDGASMIHVTISDNETAELIDLAGKTITLRYALNGGATVERVMTALDQSTHRGEAEYQFLSTDLAAAGELVGEVRMQAGQSDQLTTVDQFRLSVRAPLPAAV